ncbi:nucleotide pyrophosphatase [candidate division LCP-89 bacterium B3_LCP]|uniref:Nucleotide pyrophosphatase n=1 Tax=candidate division LCP-89 bacterium B3_LCP TaxID=2012998 RepID=A0A532V502_UNCL8|nr:MAG: nucleotide pyrophosphatase [candidate division LCP-89 bacterium B3_LCP]
MKFFFNKGNARTTRRVVVIGIDGTPQTFLKKHIAAGDLPHLKRITDGGQLHQMNSVQPCISSVAWSTFMTGVNPGKHRIFGFVDRKPNPFGIFLPNAIHMGAKTLWDIFSEAGKRVAVINVPVTSPPKEVNGILIGGFLSVDVLKCAYPREFGAELKQWDYRIDADANLGRNDKEAFFEDLFVTLDRRLEAARRIFEREPWDFFQLHVMETDRINHFLWEHYEKEDPKYHARFLEFYGKVDELLGEFYDRTKDDTEFIVLSDHGFCTVKKEVYLNQWLEDRGYLKLTGDQPRSVADMDSSSRAYSLIPGRVFLNLEGREQNGAVPKGAEAEALTNELAEALLTMTDPDDGSRIIEQVVRRDDLYTGLYSQEAADLIAIPYDGYDLKANVRQPSITFKGDLVGMHTFWDAALYVKDRQIQIDDFGIIDLAPSIMKMMDMEPLPEMDGRSLI